MIVASLCSADEKQRAEILMPGPPGHAMRIELQLAMRLVLIIKCTLVYVGSVVYR